MLPYGRAPVSTGGSAVAKHGLKLEAQAAAQGVRPPPAGIAVPDICRAPTSCPFTIVSPHKQAKHEHFRTAVPDWLAPEATDGEFTLVVCGMSCAWSPSCS